MTLGGMASRSVIWSTTPDRRCKAVGGFGRIAGGWERLPRQPLFAKPRSDPIVDRVRDRHHRRGVSAAVRTGGHPGTTAAPLAFAYRGAAGVARGRGHRHARALVALCLALLRFNEDDGWRRRLKEFTRILPPTLNHYAVRRRRPSFWLWLPRAHARGGVPARFTRQLDGQANTARNVAHNPKIGRRVEEILLSQPEVVATARRTGRAEYDEHVQGVEAAEIDVGLRETDRPRDVLLAELRRQFATLPGTNVTIGQPISHRIDHMLSGTRANIAVKVFGDDLGTLRRLGERVRAAVQPVPGVVDLSLEQQMDVPFVRFVLNRSVIARYGLRPGDVADAIETSLAGATVGRIFDRGTAFDLTVKFDPEARAEFERIADLPIDTPSGATVPIRVLADVRREQGPNMVLRENVQRRIVISCNVAGRDLGSVVDDIRSAVSRAVPMPAGYRVEYGGQFESEQSASQRLLVLGVVSIAAVFMLLVLAFGRARDALIVMSNLPLALIGGVAGVFLSGGVLNVATMIGFITLFGIATRNGIMLVTHIHHLMDVEGVRDFREAVERGAEERLVPILMTAAAAGLALIPLSLRGGQTGSEIQTPMAIVILCGLTTSTLLNMFVVPTLYLKFGSPVATVDNRD